ncbi:MAG: PaaI family thioesterase [Lachnospiraceae bacterium]|nr:PaaI family thioesterase [Lachnospiraceae bacterium]
MAHFDSLEQAREFFKNDRFATGNGMQIEELSEDHCVCSMQITDDHKNAIGGVMGGAIFSLGDFAFAVTVNNVHMPSVAQQMSCNFLSAPKEGVLTARAKVKRSGRTSTIVNIDITDDKGRDIAQIVGTGYKL